MTDTLKVAEQKVRDLITQTNRTHPDASWRYELTSDVGNIEVASDPVAHTHTLRVHPCWLRYVVSQGDFKSCVADEIDAFYLLARLTGQVTSAA
jgi:hypothetical protein